MMEFFVKVTIFVRKLYHRCSSGSNEPLMGLLNPGFKVFVVNIKAAQLTNIRLKELRNYNRKLFLCSPNNRRFYAAVFRNKFTLWHVRLNIYIWKIKFSSHKQCLVFSSLEMQRRLILTKVYYKHFYCLKRKVSQTLKSKQLQKSFSQVYIS